VAAALAALAAQQGSGSRLEGIGHLRGHETDRLAALETMMRAFGAQITAGPDSLDFAPSGKLTGATVSSSGDHRLVHAAALVGLAVPAVAVQGAEAVAKTLPDFRARWEELANG
jgi:3-phosphoshikimate 1-carboxyvinyltransferase